MNSNLLLVLRIIFSVLLVFFLFWFILVFSAFQTIDSEEIGVLAGEIAGESVVQGSLLEDYLDSEELNFEDLYTALEARCLIEDPIYVNEIGIEVDCEELLSKGPEGLRDIVKNQISARISEEISTNEEFQDIPENYERISKLTLFGLGAICLVLAILVVLLSFPISTAFISMGIIGLISGIPFIFVRFSNRIPIEIQAIKDLATSIADAAFLNFFIVFIAGALLLGAGIILNLKRKSQNKEKGKKRK